MKKLKMGLTALAIFAVVGGALAFKTAKYQSFCVFAQNGTGACPRIEQDADPSGTNLSVNDALITNDPSTCAQASISNSLCNTPTVTYSQE